MSSAGRVLQVVQPPDGGVAEHAMLLSLGLRRRGWEWSDVFLLPSPWEALPLGIIEAMNCGLPVIATRVGGVPELVEGGVTGRLVPAGDVEAFAGAVKELVADPDRRRSMGEEGREVAATRFGVDRMVEETEALLLELLGGARRGKVHG